MCVICHKAKVARLPREDEFRDMWTKNSDGAGVMWRRDDGRIEFRKGFMKLADFLKWHEASAKFLENREVAYHFRITTHGGTNPGNTHPFVCSSAADPHMLSGVADYVLMHNGIIHGIEPRRKDISDSAELALYSGGYTNPDGVLRILNPFLSGNRILLFSRKGGSMYFGDKFVEHDGLMYSNLNHITSKYSGFGFCDRSAWYDAYDSGFDEDGMGDYDMWVDNFMTSAEQNARQDGEEAVLMSGKWYSSTSGEELSPLLVDPSTLNDKDRSVWDDDVFDIADREFFKKVEEDEQAAATA